MPNICNLQVRSTGSVVLNFAGDESVRFRFVFKAGRRRAAAAARGGLKICKIEFSGYSTALKGLYL